MKEEVEDQGGEAIVFFSKKGANNLKDILAKKGIIEIRGWGKFCIHRGKGRIALVKEFYANLRDKKNLTCYVRGK